MNRIAARFEGLGKEGQPAFIPYITAGDPTTAVTEDIMIALEAAGADVIECGVPFSDPLGDGVVIQEASQRALKNGVSLKEVVGLVRRFREGSELPILLFTYYNPVLSYGVEALAESCAEAGVDGVLCVDLPPDDAKEYLESFKARDIATVFLLAPTSTAERIELVARHSTGFIYYVSRRGVTGEQATIEDSVKGMVEEIKKHTDLPVAVGFGIGTPSQAGEVGEYADGVVVGSAIVRLIGELGEGPDTAAKVGAFAKSLADGAKGTR